VKGKTLADDMATGKWREHPYEVRVEALSGNQNWFPVSEFIAMTSST
jgi:hypothetical protein